MTPIRTFAVAVLLSFAISQAGAQTRNKPRVPPGVDPGGVLVAVIGNGIDYARPEIAARLARDGEGEIAGWDFIDDDRRPFERCGERTVAPEHCNETSLALLTSPTARIMPLRAGMSRPQSLVEAVRLATQAGARIVVVVQPEAPPAAFIDDAAGFHSRPLFIAVAKQHSRRPPGKLFLGENFVMAVEGSDTREAIAATVASIVIQAIACSARGSTDARGIRDCAVGISPRMP